jgi:hypothetical protein
MKKLFLLIATLACASFVLAAEPTKAAAAEKPKASAKTDAKCDDVSCCDEDAKPADAKTAKATEQKGDAKKDAAKTVAKSDKK